MKFVASEIARQQKPFISIRFFPHPQMGSVVADIIEAIKAGAVAGSAVGTADQTFGSTGDPFVDYQNDGNYPTHGEIDDQGRTLQIPDGMTIVHEPNPSYQFSGEIRQPGSSTGEVSNKGIGVFEGGPPPTIDGEAQAAEGSSEPGAIVSVGENPNTVSNSTTRFIQQAPSQYARVVNPIGFVEKLISGNEFCQEQSLKDFLAKPYLVTSGSFTDSDTLSTFARTDLYGVLSTTGLYSNKLQGYFAIRADVKIQIVVNGNPFVQGRYMLVWRPNGGTNSNNTPASTSRRFDLCTQTQLPHVELDVSSETSATLEIPYVSCTTHAPINSPTGTIGSPGAFHIAPYVKMASGQSVGYQLYISFHNVHLHAPAVPQMGSRLAEPQMKVKRKSKNHTSAERDSQGLGPLSAVARVVSDSASSTSKHIPSLSWIAKPVEWVSDLLGGVAHMFGLSKPLNLAATTRSTLNWFPYAPNCDTPDASMPISLMARNQIEGLPGISRTDIDESSFDFIKTVPAYLTQFSFDTSTSAPSNLYWGAVTPEAYYKNYTYNIAAVDYFVRSSVPIHYFARMFQKWRGGIRYHIKFVKTPFHSSRLAFVFQPWDTNTTSLTTAPSYSNTHFAFREILDLRESSEFVVTIPYTAIYPYMEMWSGTTNGAAIGYFGIYLINGLTAPSTVNNTVTTIIEVSGGDDFELAVPYNNGDKLIMTAFTQMNSAKDLITNDHALPLAFGPSEVNLHPAKYCVGERFTSVYQFLKSAVSIPGSGVAGTHSKIRWDPYAIPTDYMGSAASITLNGEMDADNYALICACYALSRGGIRVRAWLESSYSSNPSVVDTSIVTNLPGTTYSGIVYDGANPGTQRLRLVQNLNYAGGVEIQLPAYQRSFARNNNSLYYNSGGGVIATNTAGLGTPHYIYSNFIGGPFAQIYLSRGVNDDFQVSQFMGVPLLRTASA